MQNVDHRMKNARSRTEIRVNPQPQGRRGGVNSPNSSPACKTQATARGASRLESKEKEKEGEMTKRERCEMQEGSRKCRNEPTWQSEIGIEI